MDRQSERLLAGMDSAGLTGNQKDCWLEWTLQGGQAIRKTVGWDGLCKVDRQSERLLAGMDSAGLTGNQKDCWLGWTLQG